MKFIKAFLIVAIAAIFTGCGNYVEEIHLKEDGSGTYKIYTDVIPASVEMAVQMTMMFSGMDTTTTINEDSLRVAIATKVWEDFPTSVDSTFDVSNEIPEEIKNKPEYKKYIDGATMFMKGGQDSGYVNMGMTYDFANTDEFQGFISFVEENQKASTGKATGPAETLSKTTAKADYSSTKNSFVRKVTYSNPQDLEDENLDKMAAMLGDGGTYQTVVITERKIKKVRGKNIKKVEDYKVTFEYDFIKTLTGNMNTDFEIIFEK